MDTKCRRERERDRSTLSLSWFSCVCITRFPPVALLLSSCSTLFSFIVLYIVIFVFKCLIIFISHHFWSVASLLVFPFYYLPVFFLLFSAPFWKAFAFLLLSASSFLPLSSSACLGLALFGISTQCQKIHDLWVKWNTTRESGLAADVLGEEELQGTCPALRGGGWGGERNHQSKFFSFNRIYSFLTNGLAMG